MPRVLTAIAALALSGCSLGSVIDLPSQPAANETPEAYYRQLVTFARLNSLFLNENPAARVQISSLRRSVAPQPGDWMACLTAPPLAGKQQRYLAVFFRNREIINSRFGIAIDGCETEQYALLPVPATINEAAGSSEMTRAAVPSGPRLPGLY